MLNHSLLPLVKRASSLFSKRAQLENQSRNLSQEEAGLELLSEQSLHQVQDALLRIVSNNNVTDSATAAPAYSRDQYSDWYIAYLDTKLQSISLNLREVLQEDGVTTDKMVIMATVKFFQVLSIIATQLTVMEVLPTLLEIQEGIFPQGFCRGQDGDAALQILFVAIGFLTMLYEPVLDPIRNQVGILRPTNALGWPVTTEAIMKCTCPLTEVAFLQIHQLFNSFGKLIPGSPAQSEELLPPAHSDVFAEQLVVSYLNFAILTNVGKIGIIFVDSLSLHLEFDEKTKMLKIFRLPSYCRLLCSGNPGQRYHSDAPRVAYLSSLYGEYFAGEGYGSNQQPANIVHAEDLAREVLLSYRLLFNQNTKSRKAFKAYYKRSARAAKLTNHDPLLEELSTMDCSQSLYQHINASEPAPQYAVKQEFPLLGQRLIRLQRFILSQNPSDWDGLQHDRRDIRIIHPTYCLRTMANMHQVRYYTFWAVIWVGGASVTLSFIQCILSLIQVYYSAK